MIRRLADRRPAPERGTLIGDIVHAAGLPSGPVQNSRLRGGQRDQGAAAMPKWSSLASNQELAANVL